MNGGRAWCALSVCDINTRTLKKDGSFERDSSFRSMFFKPVDFWIFFFIFLGEKDISKELKWYDTIPHSNSLYLSFSHFTYRHTLITRPKQHLSVPLSRAKSDLAHSYRFFQDQLTHTQTGVLSLVF